MPNVRLIPSTITEIALIQFSLVVLKGPSNCRDHAISPREKYLEMDWRAADKVAAWKLFKAAYEGDLRGRPGTRGETVCPDICGRR